MVIPPIDDRGHINVPRASQRQCRHRYLRMPVNDPLDHISPCAQHLARGRLQIVLPGIRPRHGVERTPPTAGVHPGNGQRRPAGRGSTRDVAGAVLGPIDHVLVEIGDIALEIIAKNQLMTTSEFQRWNEAEFT